MRRAPRIACVGHASIDHVFDIDAFPARPTKTPAHRYRMHAGGMSFNAAVAAARLGATVRMIGRVGEDASAAFLRGCLAAEGIEARGLETVPGAQTSLSAVVVDAHGTRQIYNHRGNALARAHPLDLALLDGADVVLADPRWTDGAAAALAWARERRVLSVLDADVAPVEDLRRLVPLAQWAVFSEPGLGCYAPDAAADAALCDAVRSGCTVAMLTRGEHGCSWTRGGGDALRRCRALPVRARDTTGAGDVFHAALAVALAEGRQDAAAAAFASAAAAFKCERGLGAAGAPTRGELARWLAARPGRRSR